MSPCLYYESVSIPWVHVYTISPCPCLYHESLSIQCVLVYNMSPCQKHESMSIIWVKKFKLRRKRKINYKNKIFRNKEIPITDILKYKLLLYRYTNDRNTEIPIKEIHFTVIQITEVQKYKLRDYRNTSEKSSLKIQKFTHNS